MIAFQVVVSQAHPRTVFALGKTLWEAQCCWLQCRRSQPHVKNAGGGLATSSPFWEAPAAAELGIYDGTNIPGKGVCTCTPDKEKHPLLLQVKIWFEAFKINLFLFIFILYIFILYIIYLYLYIYYLYFFFKFKNQLKNWCWQQIHSALSGQTHNKMLPPKLKARLPGGSRVMPSHWT